MERGRMGPLAHLRGLVGRHLPTLTGAQGRYIQRRLRRRGFERAHYDLGAGQVYCWTGGRGAPVVLLHGFGASSEWQWASQMGTLIRNHRVIVPDLLYFGGSTSRLPTPGLELQVDVTVQLLDHLGVTRADFVGTSYGGFVAQAMATQHPERVRRLVLVDSPGSVFEEADYAHILNTFGIRELDELLLPDSDDAMRRLMNLAWHDAPKIPRFILADARRALFGRHVEQKSALLADLVSYMGQGHPLPETFWSRTLLLWGAHDPIFPVSLAERVSQAWGGARLVVIPGASHAPQLERPRLFNTVLQRFIDAA